MQWASHMIEKAYTYLGSFNDPASARSEPFHFLHLTNLGGYRNSTEPA
jgi:hypothetical protein